MGPNKFKRKELKRKKERKIVQKTDHSARSSAREGSLIPGLDDHPL